MKSKGSANMDTETEGKGTTMPEKPAGQEEAADVKGAVRRQFSQTAAHYRASQVHAGGVELEQMLALARLRGDETVLDAGCGPGHTALAFAPHVGQVIAVDLSQEMLAEGRRLARERGIDNVEFRLGDVEALPFPEGSFDLVTSRYSAHHWPHPLQALREFRRVLRAGPRPGRLLLADVVSFDDFTVDTHVQAMELLRDPSHVRDHTVGQWLAMLDRAGFQGEAAFTWALRLDFASWVARMETPALQVAAIRALLQQAPEEVRQALRVEADCSFTFPCAVFQGVLADGTAPTGEG